MKDSSNISQIPVCGLPTKNKEIEYITEAINSGRPLCESHYTQLCSDWLANQIGSAKVFLTNSCTAALEMSAILANIQPGDEVIMPSFTFASTANAFVLQGAVPVFVDINPNTLNIDPQLIEAAITKKTKAIVPMHYAGVSCDMDAISAIANQHNLIIIEDAAQAILSSYQNKQLGGIGDMGTLSFHHTKNITSGLGGAILINNPELIERAKIIWQKGTNRDAFFEGKVDKYTWVDKGSSFMPSEITAAFLWSQLESAQAITQSRMQLWQKYHDAFAELELSSKIQRPIIPSECQHNAHVYYLLLPSRSERLMFMSELKKLGIDSSFHFIPLHSSPAGEKFGRTYGQMHNTDNICDRLMRLPLWPGLEDKIDYIIEQVTTLANTLLKKETTL